jgi:hypothetical protein
MTDVGQRWIVSRQNLHEAARGTKDTQFAAIELSRRYAELPDGEKSTVDRVISEWLASDDASLRFDALLLVDDHRIASAIPALRRLADRLEGSSKPSAPYEWAKVNRILARLSESGSR